MLGVRGPGWTSQLLRGSGLSVMSGFLQEVRRSGGQSGRADIFYPSGVFRRGSTISSDVKNLGTVRSA